MNYLRFAAALPAFVRDRVDWREFLDTIEERLEDVDQKINGDEPADVDDSTQKPVTPYERLIATPGVVVSRDFRDVKKWDRTKTYDWRKYGWPGDKSRGQSRGKLPWDKITTIVLHTADANGMHPDRWLGVPSHCAVADDSTAVLQHRLDAYLWAAHALNRFSMSLEIAGKGAITDAQIPVARALVRFMYETRQSHHEGQMYIAPHRFGHRSRVRDCDSAIWNAVGVWAMDELGLELGPVVGSGKPLPFP